MALHKVVHYGGLLGDEVVAVSCPAKDIALAPRPRREVARVVARHHYSGTACTSSAVSLAVTWRGQFSGALQLGYGVRPDKNARGGETWEFDRMWLANAMPKYSETIVLSLLHLYLRRAHPNVRRIVTYADASVGHTGTIYRAANYRRVGATPVDFYRLADGTRVHPVTMWHRHRTRAWAVLQRLYPGIEHVKGPGLVHVKYEFLLRREDT